MRCFISVGVTCSVCDREGRGGRGGGGGGVVLFLRMEDGEEARCCLAALRMASVRTRKSWASRVTKTTQEMLLPCSTQDVSPEFG